MQVNTDVVMLSEHSRLRICLRSLLENNYTDKT